MKELVSVIIPILDPNLNPVQERLLHHCLEALARYPVIFITFPNADLSIIKEHQEEIDVIYFPKEYFQSRQTLAKLFLMEDFYDQFSWASYLLIHELNSWIVKDELYYWCKQGYDYLKAAPASENQPSNIYLPNAISRLKGLNPIEKQNLGDLYQDNGLSLCLIERMISTLKSKNKIAYSYRHNELLTNADSVFWEIEANRFLPHLRKPSSIVRNYFAQNVINHNIHNSVVKEKLPFAFTGINSTNINDLPYFQ